MIDTFTIKVCSYCCRKGTITEAANELYISQPSLTKAIKELEKEMGITIFVRTNKGITISKDGEQFLSYARQVLEQANLLEEKYKHTNSIIKNNSVYQLNTIHLL